MGYIRHNSIIVTGKNYPEAHRKFELAYNKAKELFDDLVSGIVKSKINGYQSFFVAPDGSKEGWDMSDEYNTKRKDLSDYIDSLAYDDGSNCVQFVDVGYDGYREAEIDRTNVEYKECPVCGTYFIPEEGQIACSAHCGENLS